MNKISIDDLKGFSTYSKIRETINDLIDEVELLKVKIIDLEEANSNLKEVLTDHLQMYFDANIDLEEANSNLKEVLADYAQIKNAYR